MTDSDSVDIVPITDQDLAEVCDFLREKFESPCSLQNWTDGFRHQWHPARPNNGFMIRDGKRLTGAFLAFYSIRTIRGKPEQFCNPSSLFVLESHRAYSLQLIRRLLGQPDFHYSVFTANEVASKIYTAMRFKPLPDTAYLLPTVRLPLKSDIRILSTHEAIGNVLQPDRHRIFVDHAECRNIEQIAAGNPQVGYCHVIFRKGHSKGIACANILDVSDPRLFLQLLDPICLHLLMARHCWLLRVGALQLHGAKPRFALLLQEPKVAFYRSRSLDQYDMSPLYTELVAICGC